MSFWSQQNAFADLLSGMPRFDQLAQAWNRELAILLGLYDGQIRQSRKGICTPLNHEQTSLDLVRKKPVSGLVSFFTDLRTLPERKKLTVNSSKLLHRTLAENDSAENLCKLETG